MNFGCIIPTAAVHGMQELSRESCRRYSRSTTPVVALFNGIDSQPVPDGVGIECAPKFDDESDLWWWCLSYAIRRGWDWCLVAHDDFAMRESGWEDQLEESTGWRVALASWCVYGVWDEEANSGEVVAQSLGTVLDSFTFAFRPDVFLGRGCISEVRYGFGFGAWDANAWALDKGYGVWRVLLGSDHQWQARNTRAALSVGAPGHPDIKKRFLGSVLPAYVVDRTTLSVGRRLMRCGPESAARPLDRVVTIHNSGNTHETDTAAATTRTSRGPWPPSP